jgi:glycosyltransferase involved in cell wall biosynthesis
MTTPRTILMTADTIGGVWTYATELIRALEMYGVHVVLATFGRKLSPAQAKEAAGLINADVCEGAFKLEWMEDPWEDVERARDWLLQIEEEFEPCVIHLNHYAHGALPWKAPVVMAGHSCVLSWWRAVRGDAVPAEWSRYAEVVEAGLRAADLVVAPSEFMLRELDHFYGPFSATAVVPNGRALPPSPPARKEPFIFASGRLWDHAKNIQMLCDIAADLPWEVYVAGDTADKLCVRDVVRLGQLSAAEMIPYLNRASIYALPARYEPFGLSVLEAALAGCALVLGDTPSLRQIWAGAALFVSPTDPKDLKDALYRLIRDERLRNDLAAAARRTAAYYTPQRCAARYVKLYGTLVSEAKVGRGVSAEPSSEALCAS